MIGEKNIKEMTGMVVSNKGDKTITVSVDRVKTHPLYKKRYTVSKKYYAHDAENTANVGDKVRIRESRPMSKMKRWVLVDIIEKGVE